MLLMREARLEMPYKSVNMWTYRLRSERIPKSYFDAPPSSYDEGNRSTGFAEWACESIGLGGLGKTLPLV